LVFENGHFKNVQNRKPKESFEKTFSKMTMRPECSNFGLTVVSMCYQQRFAYFSRRFLVDPFWIKMETLFYAKKRAKTRSFRRRYMYFHEQIKKSCRDATIIYGHDGLKKSILDEKKTPKKRRKERPYKIT
jgi:hypothetical protein